MKSDTLKKTTQLRGFFLRNPCSSGFFWQSLQRQHDTLQAPEKQSESIYFQSLFF